MDVLMLHLFGRILMIVGALIFIILGIVLLTKKQSDEEKCQTAKKNGQKYIWLGIMWLVLTITLCI